MSLAGSRVVEALTYMHCVQILGEQRFDVATVRLMYNRLHQHRSVSTVDVRPWGMTVLEYQAYIDGLHDRGGLILCVRAPRIGI